MDNSIREAAVIWWQDQKKRTFRGRKISRTEAVPWAKELAGLLGVSVEETLECAGEGDVLAEEVTNDAAVVAPAGEVERLRDQGDVMPRGKRRKRGGVSVADLIKQHWVEAGGDSKRLLAIINAAGRNVSLQTIYSTKSALVNKMGWKPPKIDASEVVSPRAVRASAPAALAAVLPSTSPKPKGRASAIDQKIYEIDKRLEELRIEAASLDADRATLVRTKEILSDDILG